MGQAQALLNQTIWESGILSPGSRIPKLYFIITITLQVVFRGLLNTRSLIFPADL
jgi:hypothetical protein